MQMSLSTQYDNLTCCNEGPQRLRVAQQIAEGMMYLHSFDYMHRDLKSLNILVFNRLRLFFFWLLRNITLSSLVSFRGESSVDIKISDFGSARIVDFTMSVDGNEQIIHIEVQTSR